MADWASGQGKEVGRAANAGLSARVCLGASGARLASSTFGPHTWKAVTLKQDIFMNISQRQKLGVCKDKQKCQILLNFGKYFPCLTFFFLP